MNPFLARVFYRVHERLMGRGTFGILGQLLQSQAWPRERIRALQLDRLRALAACAYQNTPYWREVMDRQRIRPQDIRSLDDLQRFPLLDKETIRRRREEMVAPKAAKGVHCVSTSGSSNAALQFYTSASREAHISAARMRGHLSVGIAPEDRELYFWSAPVEVSVQGPIRRLRDAMRNDGFANPLLLGPGIVRQHLCNWTRWKPTCIFGYPSSLSLLATFAQEAQLDLTVLREKGLRAIVTTAELLGRHRQCISAAFGVPVYDSYGLREGGLIGHDCDRFTMHTNDEQVILETIDRRTGQPTGGDGELVVTMLVSHAMPIIRYRTGDIVSLSSEPCPCGRNLGAIRMAGGRVLEFFVTSQGRCVNVVAINQLCLSVKGIRQLQVRQDRLGELRVLILRGKDFPPDGLARIQAGVRALVDRQDKLLFEFVDNIAPAPSGKELLVVSKVARTFLEERCFAGDQAHPQRIPQPTETLPVT